MNEASALPSKVCSACGGRFPADALFCPTDGSPLLGSAGEHAPDPYLGQEISGHIEIRQLVGVGAMGRVYRAFQRGIDRDVAVKILHRELSANAQLVSRFTREAKVASRLQHPNVVQVLLAGQLPDRALYMVMEYLDGLSLQSALAAADGAFPLPRALHVALQLCEATGEAHAQGIVHRDLKPENVMLVRRGSDPDCVKVLDFGIARMSWGEQSVATAAGLIFGTARYISPEGAQGNTVGPASDVYAIGTILYQMLSGRTPFDGDQAVGLLVQQIHNPAPHLKSIGRAAYVPDPISDVVMATLAKDPAQREPDARALGQAIFDAAKLAGLSPDDFSRPMLKRQPSAIKMAPMQRTSQHELTPDVVARMTPHATPDASGNTPSPAANGSLGQRPPTAATVKWEPPSEFQARLADGMRTATPEERHVRGAPNDRGSSPSTPPLRADRGSRPRMPSSVDETIDDLMLDPRDRQVSAPAFPTRDESSARRLGGGMQVPRTMPGEPDVPPRTHYTPPAPETVQAQRPGSGSEYVAPRPPSNPEVAPTPGRTRYDSTVPAPEPSERRARGWLVVLVCFVLGAALALGWAWKVGKVGGSSEPDAERIAARATDAMFKNHFHEPPGDNVRDLTDEGLRRWPNDRRLLDIRVRAANELTSQAMAQRSAGDLAEALKLARIAHDLDPHDASAKRLLDQYEAELATFSPSAAPTLARPPDPPSPPTTKASVPAPSPPPPSPPPTPQRADYKALLDVSHAAPRLGQPIELVAKVAPAKGDFDAPGFTIVGPGVTGGVRVPATALGGGVFKATYAFLEPGRFEIAFTTQETGKQISAKRTVLAGTPAPAPTAPPAPTPTTTGSVKWM